MTLELFQTAVTHGTVISLYCSAFNRYRNDVSSKYCNTTHGHYMSNWKFTFVSFIVQQLVLRFILSSLLHLNRNKYCIITLRIVSWCQVIRYHVTKHSLFLAFFLSLKIFFSLNFANNACGKHSAHCFGWK